MTESRNNINNAARAALVATESSGRIKVPCGPEKRNSAQLPPVEPPAHAQALWDYAAFSKLPYERQLPLGGDREYGIAQKLHQSVRSLEYEPEVKDFLKELANEYYKTPDRYYSFKPLGDAMQEKWLNRLSTACVEHDRTAEWVCRVVLEGMPRIVSDFRMNGQHVVVRPDGKRDRMVTLQNVYGQQSGLVTLDTRSICRLRRFREWLLNRGNYHWDGTLRDLQALLMDLNFDFAFPKVAQVAASGLHDESALGVPHKPAL